MQRNEKQNYSRNHIDILPKVAALENKRSWEWQIWRTLVDLQIQISIIFFFKVWPKNPTSISFVCCGQNMKCVAINCTGLQLTNFTFKLLLILICRGRKFITCDLTFVVKEEPFIRVKINWSENPLKVTLFCCYCTKRYISAHITWPLKSWKIVF